MQHHAQASIECTDTQKVKPMTKQEDEQYAKDLEQFAQWRKDEADKAKAKEALLAKLGITADEAALLLS